MEPRALTPDETAFLEKCLQLSHAELEAMVGRNNYRGASEPDGGFVAWGKEYIKDQTDVVRGLICTNETIRRLYLQHAPAMNIAAACFVVLMNRFSLADAAAISAIITTEGPKILCAEHWKNLGES